MNDWSPDEANPLPELVKWTLTNKFQRNLNQSSTIFRQEMILKMSFAKCQPLSLSLSGLHCTHIHNFLHPIRRHTHRLRYIFCVGPNNVCFRKRILPWHIKWGLDLEGKKWSDLIGLEQMLWHVSSLAPGAFDYSLKLVNFKLILTINILSIFCEISIRWMPQ